MQITSIFYIKSVGVVFFMRMVFDSTNVEIMETEKEVREETVSYEHAGYQVRVYFNGEKTLAQCIQNLAERKIAG